MADESLNLRLDQARELLSRYEFPQAMTQLKAVLAALAGMAGETELKACAHELAGEAAHRMGEFPLAEEHLQQANILFDELGDGKRLLRSQLFLAECVLRQGNLGAASHLVSDAEARASAAELPGEQARCKVLQGSIAWYQSRLPQAVAFTEEAIAEFYRLGMMDELNWAKSSLAVCYAVVGDDQPAARLFTEALDYFQEAGNVTQMARCLNNLGGIAFANEDYARSREYLLQCVGLESMMHARGDMAPTWLNLGLIETREGNYKLARKYLNRSFQLAVEVGDRESEGVALINLGIVALLESNLDEAINYSRLSSACFEGSVSSNADRCQNYLPVFHLAHGRPDAAKAAWDAKPQLEDPIEMRSLAMLLKRVVQLAAQEGTNWPEETVAIAGGWLQDIALDDGSGF